MEYRYKPKGVCSQEIVFDIKDNVIQSMYVVGGCNGNLKGVSALCKGRTVDEVIASLDGIKCGMKPTSCPDQIAQALKNYRS